MPAAEPIIEFGPWCPWKDRNTLHLPKARGGVYLLGHFIELPLSRRPSPDRLEYQVVYVGDAKDLNKRPLSGVHHKIERYASSLCRSIVEAPLSVGRPVLRHRLRGLRSAAHGIGLPGGEVGVAVRLPAWSPSGDFGQRGRGRNGIPPWRSSAAEDVNGDESRRSVGVAVD